MLTTFGVVDRIPAPLRSPLFVLRILSPLLVLLLSTISIIFTRAPNPKSPSPITPVVVATRIPRRALILAFLSLLALTFLADGLTFVIYTVLNKSWPQYTGIEISSVIGLVAFAGLAALGAWKDVHGVDVWSLNRLKVSFAFALTLDIAQLYILSEFWGSEYYLRNQICREAYNQFRRTSVSRSAASYRICRAPSPADLSASDCSLLPSRCICFGAVRGRDRRDVIFPLVASQ